MPIKSARNKGHAYERRLVKIFKDLGFTGCSTSRFTSKKMDDEKIDLCGTRPIFVQAKAVERLGCVHTILESMKKEVGVYNTVFHKKNRKGTIVSMSEKDFLAIVKMLIDSGAISPEC